MTPSPGRSSHDWKGIVARLRRSPNRWLLVLPNVPTSTEKYVRLRRHPDLRLTRGHVDAMIRNVYDDAGQTRGDLFMRFVNKSPMN